jgi:hypothetical protein
MALEHDAQRKGFAKHATVALGVALAVAIVIASSAGACLPTGRACLPGDYVSCACPGDVAGAALCDDIGSSYGACDCTFFFDAGLDASESDAPQEAEAAASDAGGVCSGTSNLELTCPCSDDSSCASDFCFTYPSKGPHCSAHCTTDAQCPPPALGCNPQGICKIP